MLEKDGSSDSELKLSEIELLSNNPEEKKAAAEAEFFKDSDDEDNF